LIDARNILSLAKLVKMNTSAEHPFISGGGIPTATLQQLLASKNRQGIEKILKDFSGEVDVSFDLVKLEASLYRGISRSLVKGGRDILGIGPVLEYLWRCSIEAMNLSVLAYGHELERDIVAAELVR
jgi:vacuolar-type H+-ATPase subunit C/Vma6